jgi:hypothetical protein
MLHVPETRDAKTMFPTHPPHDPRQVTLSLRAMANLIVEQASAWIGDWGDRVGETGGKAPAEGHMQ